MKYRSYKKADLIDEDSLHKVMKAKGLSLGNTCVQQLNLLVINTGRMCDADDLVLKDTSFYCMDLHPPLVHLHRRQMSVYAGYRWARLPWIVGAKVSRVFGKLHS